MTGVKKNYLKSLPSLFTLHSCLHNTSFLERFFLILRLTYDCLYAYNVNEETTTLFNKIKPDFKELSRAFVALNINTNGNLECDHSSRNKDEQTVILFNV